MMWWNGSRRRGVGHLDGPGEDQGWVRATHRPACRNGERRIRANVLIPRPCVVGIVQTVSADRCHSERYARV